MFFKGDGVCERQNYYRYGHEGAVTNGQTQDVSPPVNPVVYRNDLISATQLVLCH